MTNREIIRKNLMLTNNIMGKRFRIELGIFLHEYSKNLWDCDGFDLLPEQNKEWIRNSVLDEMDKQLRLK